jgi:hypothetical protein
MAILGSTTLTDCYYIPSFLGGLDGSSRPFHTVFENAFAPTSWTKDTSFSTNGISLRVTTGTVGSRLGPLIPTFTQVFETKSLGLSIVQNTAVPVTTGSISANVTINQATAQGQIGLDGSVEDIPAHSHTYQVNRNRPASTPGANVFFGPQDNVASGAEGSSGQHGHTLSFGQHTHGSSSTHAHTVTAGQHSHPAPGPGTQEDFSIMYRDVIIASKDVN